MRSFILVGLACFLDLLLGAVTFAATGEQGNLSLNRVLADAAFKPHFPLEKELVAKYGMGRIQVQYNDTYHIYYLPDSNLWVRCKIDGENTVDKPMMEVLVAGVELCKKSFKAKAKIEKPHLKGIRVGDRVAKVHSQWGEPLRKHSAKLGPTTATVLEFFPDSLDQGSCLRYFIRDGIVIGFSFSSEQ